jgi:hypothetical protein
MAIMVSLKVNRENQEVIEQTKGIVQSDPALTHVSSDTVRDFHGQQMRRDQSIPDTLCVVKECSSLQR